MASLQALAAQAPPEKVNLGAVVVETPDSIVLTIPKRVDLRAIKETTTDKKIPFFTVVPDNGNGNTYAFEVYERTAEEYTSEDGQKGVRDVEKSAPVRFRLGPFSLYVARK